jgi:hypothetical protein
VIFGWDISTSIIGTAILTDDGQYVSSHFLDMRKLEIDMINKAYEAERYIDTFVRSYGRSDSVHYIEDRLGSFAAGRTMQQTLLKLAAFNATVSYIIWHQFRTLKARVTIEHIHPSTVKSIMRREGLIIPKGSDKKGLTLEFVSGREPGFPVILNRNDKPQPYCFDQADAYIIACAGFRKYLKECNANQS